MEMCRSQEAETGDVTLGELSERWNEPVTRIMDAMDANKVVRGERGYIGLPAGRDGDDG